MKCATCKADIVEDDNVEIESEDLETDTWEKYRICYECALKDARAAGNFEFANVIESLLRKK